jgi:hypothetical protein
MLNMFESSRLKYPVNCLGYNLFDSTNMTSLSTTFSRLKLDHSTKLKRSSKKNTCMSKMRRTAGGSPDANGHFAPRGHFSDRQATQTNASGQFGMRRAAHSVCPPPRSLEMMGPTQPSAVNIRLSLSCNFFRLSGSTEKYSLSLHTD